MIKKEFFIVIFKHIRYNKQICRVEFDEGGFTVTILLTILQVISCIGLIATVLLQSGKSAGLSGAITGGAETFFGKKGMDDKFATWSKIFAVAFMVLTFVLSMLA